MTNGHLAAMAAVALGLSGVIAFEIAAWRAIPENPGFVRPVPFVAADAPVAAEPSFRDDGRLNAILARPLFSPDRRPVASAARSLGGLPRLTGIIVTGSRKVAIFAAPAGGKVVVADEGGRIGAYEVTTIGDSGVTMAGPEGTTVLRPIFDAAPPGGERAARTEPPRLLVR